MGDVPVQLIVRPAVVGGILIVQVTADDGSHIS
jgi:hypothetical protein